MHLPASLNTIELVRKPIPFLLVALIGVLVAVACGGTSPTAVPVPTQAPTPTVEPTATAVPATATPESTAEPRVQPTVEPTMEAPPTATTAPTPEPTATPVPEPTAEPVAAEPELTLELLDPEDLEVITEEPVIEVVGSTRVDAVVTVNDTVVEPDGQGLFSLGVDLEEGPNLIEIVASVASGEQTDLVLVVVYLP